MTGSARASSGSRRESRLTAARRERGCYGIRRVVYGDGVYKRRELNGDGELGEALTPGHGLVVRAHPSVRVGGDEDMATARSSTLGRNTRA
jgi:hypothetical protein